MFSSFLLKSFMMRRFWLLVVAMLAAYGLMAQGTPVNYPLPQNPDTLRILPFRISTSGFES